MLKSFAKKLINCWAVLLITLAISSCSDREGLAPVVELKWQAINNHATRHVVVRSETLYAIAFRYDQDYRQLAISNHLRSPYTLRVGQVLNVRSPLYSSPRPRPIVQPPPRYHARLPQRATPWRSTPVAQRSQFTGWQWPARGRVAAYFVPQQGKKGINIAGNKGEKIHAANSGVVAYAGSGLPGYGNLIIIKHNNQYLTAYANNQRNLVHEGQSIQTGQIIAEMGVIDRRYWGVHFEIRKAGKPVNPLNYLQKG